MGGSPAVGLGKTQDGIAKTGVAEGELFEVALVPEHGGDLIVVEIAHESIERCSGLGVVHAELDLG